MTRSTFFTTMSLVLPAVAVLLAGVAVTQAATVGHWRFEDTPGLLEDSSTYDNDLTAIGAPTHVTLAGVGSAIDNPIPQTGAANLKAVDFNGIDDCYSCGDQDEFAVTDFTIEAYVRIDDTVNLHMIASQYTLAENDRSWYFAYEGGKQRILVQCGSESRTYTNGQLLIAGHEYYLAVSYDGDGTTGGVQLYAKDLTLGSDLRIISWDKTVVAPLNDADCDFMVGSYAGHPDYYTWDGLIDEVRFSDTVLSEDELLISHYRWPGDANSDRVVDATDAAVLAAHWLQQENAAWADGDFNEDGKVDAVDATILAANWGPVPTGCAASSVPEPGVLTLLLGAMLILIVRRHRQVQ